jgi:hypothetical protein
LALDEDTGHATRRVARAGGCARRNGGSEHRGFLSGEVDLERADVLFERLTSARTWNRDRILSLGQQPGERDLGGRTALSLRKLFDMCDEATVRGEILALKARMRGATAVDVVKRAERAGKKAAAQR